MDRVLRFNSMTVTFTENIFTYLCAEQRYGQDTRNEHGDIVTLTLIRET